MKKVLTKFMAFGSIGLLMLSACKKSGTEVMDTGSKSSALTASATTLVLDKTRLNDTTYAITFNITAPSYSFKAVVKNYLQIDAAGDNWKNPTTALLSPSGGTQGYSTANFNALLLKLNLPAATASQVNVRVANELSSDVMTFSNVLSLTVTPFNLQSWVYVPGAYEGWSFPGTTADSLYSATSNGIYVGIINFTAGNNQFLVVPAQSWNNKWATTQGANTSGTTITYPVTYNGPNNFYAPATAGQYLVTLNTNTNVITIQPADYYTIIGSAPPGTAWNNDYAMKYVNDGNGNWVATNVPMVAGEYKFRQDDAWTNSWGPSATAGTITDSNPTGDGNIQLTTAGNYNLTFYMPATPLGTTPAVTTTYTAVKQ